MDLDNIIDLIQDNIVKKLEDKLEQGKSLSNFILTMLAKESKLDDVEKVLNYSSNESDDALIIGRTDLTPPFYLSIDLIRQIKERCEIDTPLAIIYFEKKEKPYKDKLLDYYAEFKSGNVKEDHQNKFYIHYETYRGIKKFEYEISDDKKITQIGEIETTRIFLPIYN